ncbi:hypothetical protein NE237_014812 [Protea cynaroides]|uniref:X8 domain-containing protein n=1 Tax=Protea cynaroides TaxID=273540 RepID=A0A9Q0KCR2_9MAGN|nr:hypothetical protein NE237_014812 [Protea cynaroides]
MAGVVFRSCFFFFFLLLVLIVRSSGTMVGFYCDARREGATSLAIETISFLENNKVSPSQIRVLVPADSSVLDSLSNTGVNIDLYLHETEVENLKTHLATVLHRVNITSIVVSCSQDSSVAPNQLPFTLNILRSIHSALRCLNLERPVKVSMAFTMSFLEKINENHGSGLHAIIDFIKKSNSFIVIESVIRGELSMGNQFIRMMIETATRATTALPYVDAPMVVIVHSSASPSAVEVTGFTSKIMRSVEDNTHFQGLDGLFAEISPMKDSEREELKWGEEQIFPSSRSELLDNINDRRALSQAKTTLHDQIDQPPATLPETTITNPVTTPAATIPPDNPSPTITVPSTNPVTITPTNPTTPVINPVTAPLTPPVTNPVTTYPISPPSSIPKENPVSASPPTTGQTWCVAKDGALEIALQAALDYACGVGGTDCSPIQSTGNCNNQTNNLQSIASYAINSYYQKNPVPTSCNFGGAAMIVNSNPSTASCVYPSSSSSAAATTPGSASSSSVPGSATTSIDGSEPPPSFNSTSVSISAHLQPLFGIIVLVVSIITGNLVTAA